jgi:ribonuclease P protein component
MLNKNYRLTKVRDFNLLIKHGQWVNGRFLQLKLLELAKFEQFFPKKEDPEVFKKQLRLAINVGLKVSKKAVERNRLRRQLSEVVRLLLKDGKVGAGFYVMVMAKPGALGQDYAVISQELESLFKRSGLVK